MTPRVFLTWELEKLCVGVVFAVAALTADHTGSKYPTWLLPVAQLPQSVSAVDLHDMLYDLLDPIPVFPSPDVGGKYSYCS